jgi:hypothetical protein
MNCELLSSFLIASYVLVIARRLPYVCWGIAEEA